MKPIHAHGYLDICTFISQQFSCILFPIFDYPLICVDPFTGDSPDFSTESGHLSIATPCFNSFLRILRLVIFFELSEKWCSMSSSDRFVVSGKMLYNEISPSPIMPHVSSVTPGNDHEVSIS